MAHISKTSQASRLLVSHSQKVFTRLLATRTINSSSINLFDNHASSSHNYKVSRRNYGENPVNSRLMRLRTSLNKSANTVQATAKRNQIVNEIYRLTYSATSGDDSVDSLMKSKANSFKSLRKEVIIHKDFFSDGQLIRLLTCLMKIKTDTISDIIALLEREIKFRICTLSIDHVIKLMRLYDSLETDKQKNALVCCLDEQLRSILLHDDRTTLKDLTELYLHFAKVKHVQMLALIEEKLLYQLTFTKVDRVEEEVQEGEAEQEQGIDDDLDMISRYLPKHVPYDYFSLCNIFIGLASAKRRPTPLLKAVSDALEGLFLSEAILKSDSDLKVLSKCLIEALDSLVILSYTNRAIVAKLVRDLIGIIRLEDLDMVTQCTLLRCMQSLRWRSDELMRLYYEYVGQNSEDISIVDHNITSTLIHVTASLNYKPNIDIQTFYNDIMVGARENKIRKNPRRWLDYVWSLTVLRVANDEHFDSILSEEFLLALQNPLNLPTISSADSMKLLNLRALASLERSRPVKPIAQLDELQQIKLAKSSAMLTFIDKVNLTLNTINATTKPLCFGILTPFGFQIDCAITLDEDSNISPISEAMVLADLSRPPSEKSIDSQVTGGVTKMALIYVGFDETIANHPYEPVGHRKIISRILRTCGYKTVFIQERKLVREQSNTNFVTKIENMIKFDSRKKAIDKAEK